jgi:hypothetical protein
VYYSVLFHREAFHDSDDEKTTASNLVQRQYLKGSGFAIPAQHCQAWDF